MNLSTFRTLKRALKTRDYNELELKQLKKDAKPLMVQLINHLTVNNLNVNSKLTSVNILTDSKDYKDEVVITFLLFIGNIVNIEKIRHTFAVPFSDSIFNWVNLYKLIVYNVLTLMYDIKWSDKNMFFLDEMILKINEGHASALREFMNRLNILSSKDIIYEAEVNYENIGRAGVGPFYWRMLHFMAEALDLRKNRDFAKLVWKEFTVYSMHRTLKCPICEEHYAGIVKNFKARLLNSEIYYKLWFDIHNEINKELNKQPYSEKEFEKDRKIMQKLLLQQ